MSQATNPEHLTAREAGPGQPVQWSHIKVGMVCFLCSEAAFFSTLIIAYIAYLGHGGDGRFTPGNMLEPTLAILGSVCLISSSGTMFLAERSLKGGSTAAFQLFLFVTVILGVLFLVLTGVEWAGLIGRGLTIQVNLFGSTYYTLLGFHGFHVSLGILAMLIVLGLSLPGHVTPANAPGIEMLSWYWHFVDAVWVVIFTLVYVVGR